MEMSDSVKCDDKGKAALQRQLLVAVKISDLHAINRLLKKELDVNYKDADGVTPMWVATKFGDIPVAQLLLENGASIEVSEPAREPALFSDKELEKMSKQSEMENILPPIAPLPIVNETYERIDQLKYILFYLSRGIADKCDFRLKPSLECSRQFDELILRSTEDNITTYRHYHVKHKNANVLRRIRSDDLLSNPEGDYSLAKYFKYYQDSKKDGKGHSIHDYTVCTNADMDVKNLKEASIAVSKINDVDAILDFYNCQRRPIRYKFSISVIKILREKLRIINGGIETPYDDVKDFIEHFVLAVCQPHAWELTHFVKDALGKELDLLTMEKVYTISFSRILHWLDGKGDFIAYEQGKDLIEELKSGISVRFNVQPPIKTYIGRLQELEDIRKTLHEGAIVLVSGIAEFGKSELVKLYLDRYAQDIYHNIVWIDARSTQSLCNSFRELAHEALRIDQFDRNGVRKPIGDIIAEVYLHFTGSATLMIFDDAVKYQSDEDFDAGLDLFLPDLRQFQAIITSREQVWPSSIKRIELNAFSEEQAVAFIIESLKTNEKELAIELANKMDLLPLALHQAVTYIQIRQTDGFVGGLNAYLREFSERSRKNKLNVKGASKDGMDMRAVLINCHIILNAMRERQGGRDALGVLCTMCFLMPGYISKELLVFFVKDTDKLDASLNLLSEYSLITVWGKIIHIHRSVHRVVMMMMASEKRKHSKLHSILSELNGDCPYDKYPDDFVSIWSHFEANDEFLKEFHCVALNMARKLLVLGRHRTADSIAEKIFKQLGRMPKDDPKVQAGLSSCKMYGISRCVSKRNYEQAYNDMSVVCRKEEGRRGALHKNVVRLKNHLAQLLWDWGRKEKALAEYQQLLKVMRIDCQAFAAETLDTKKLIATILIELRRYKEALSTLLDVSYDFQKTFGEQSVELLTTKVTLGLLYLDLENFNAAENTFRSVLQAYNSNSSLAKYTDYLFVKDKLAKALQGLEIYDEALQINNETLDMRRQLLTEDHPDILANQCDVASGLQFTGKLDEAMLILRKVLDKQEASLIPPDRDIYKTKLLMADILYQQGQHSGALKIYRSLLELKPLMPGAYCMKLHEKIALVLMEQRELDEAIQHYEQATAIHKMILGVDHPKTLSMQIKLAAAYVEINDFDMATGILKEVQKTTSYDSSKDADIYATTSAFLENLESIRPKAADPFTAIKLNDFPLLRETLKVEDASVNMKDCMDKTLVYHAAHLNRLDMLQFLLKNGADATQRTCRGDTALHIAVEKNHFHIAEELLNHVTYDQWREFINAKQQDNGNTALHLAVQNGSHEMVLLLLSRGAIYNVINSEGKLPVDFAMDKYIISQLQKVDKIFQYLRNSAETGDIADKCTADTCHETFEIHGYIEIRNIRDYHGNNVMQLAVVFNRRYFLESIVKIELEASRKSCYPVILDGALHDLVPLTKGIFKKLQSKTCDNAMYLEQVRRLVTAFREKDKRILNFNVLMIEELLDLIEYNEKDENFMELAMIAVRTYMKVFEELIHAVTLHEAVKRNDWKAVQTHITKGVLTNLPDSEGWTPLHFAANEGNERTTNMLMASNALVDCQAFSDKSTPLHIAVKKGYLEVAKLLTLCSSSVDFINAKTEPKGDTALHLAAQQGRLDLVILLLCRNGIYCPKNNDGLTPVKMTNDPTVKIFLRRINDLFADAKKGDTRVLKTLSSLNPQELAAMSTTLDEEGFTLSQVAAVRNYKELSNDITACIKELIGKVKFNPSRLDQCTNHDNKLPEKKRRLKK